MLGDPGNGEDWVRDCCEKSEERKRSIAWNHMIGTYGDATWQLAGVDWSLSLMPWPPKRERFPAEVE